VGWYIETHFAGYAFGLPLTLPQTLPQTQVPLMGRALFIG